MKLTFYFDPISPYSWLAAHQLKKISAADLKIDCVPVLLGALLNASGQKGPAEVPVKRSYTFLDVHRRANAAGLTFEGPPEHPFNPLAALRACHCVEDRQQRFELAIALMDMAWSEGKSITDLELVRKALHRCAIEMPDLEAKLQDPQVKARVKDATQDAIDRGIFGVPTLRVEDELFWGSDRVADAIAALRGDRAAIDHELVARVLARPAAIQRK